MLKNLLGSIVFTIAVLALVNFIGDAMVKPITAPQPQASADAEPAAEPVAEVAPEPAPEPAAEPAPAAEAPAVEAAATAVADAGMGDADAGFKTFRKKCMGCHTVAKGESDRTGPNLWGIVGKAKAASEGYRYSASLVSLGGVWSEADLVAFMAGPRTFLPDTKMTFPGLKKEQDRADILAFLNTLKD